MLLQNNLNSEAIGMFFDNFEQICKQRGTSPTTVVQAIGKSRNTAANWRKNGTIPKEDELNELAKYLECEVNDFFVPYETLPKPSSVSYAEAIQQSAIDLEAVIRKENLFVDDNVEDLIRIYARCKTARQRNQLMSAVYDFEDKVLNAEEETR